MRKVWTLLLLLVVATAHAGQSCTETPPTPATVKKALLLAVKARDALEQSGAEVALVARVGQDLSKWNLRYSHLAFAWRDHPKGRWAVVHELNRCATAESDLFVEGLGNFFLDDMFMYEALIFVPPAETQQRLSAILASDLAVRMHESKYSMVAYAFSTRYQNSNQWALEVLASASANDVDIKTRADAHAWLQAARYRPTTVSIPALTRLGARMFRANIAFDDHPFERRMAGQIDTVTVDSIFRFLESRGANHRKIFVTIDSREM